MTFWEMLRRDALAPEFPRAFMNPVRDGRSVDPVPLGERLHARSPL